jgi:hypothetical protein
MSTPVSNVASVAGIQDAAGFSEKSPLLKNLSLGPQQSSKNKDTS